MNIIIRNGTIQGMGASAIDLNGGDSLVEYMNIRSNGNTGIDLTEASCSGTILIAMMAAESASSSE